MQGLARSTMSVENKVQKSVVDNGEMLDLGRARRHSLVHSTTKFTICSRHAGWLPEYKSNRFTFACWKYYSGNGGLLKNL